MKDEIKIFAGSSNRALAGAIAHSVGVPLGADAGARADGSADAIAGRHDPRPQARSAS